jgi:hypothetical protein
METFIAPPAGRAAPRRSAELEGSEKSGQGERRERDGCRGCCVWKWDTAAVTGDAYFCGLGPLG